MWMFVGESDEGGGCACVWGRAETDGDCGRGVYADDFCDGFGVEGFECQEDCADEGACVLRRGMVTSVGEC